DEHLGRPRHRYAVRAAWRAVDRSNRTVRGAQRERSRRRALLSGDLPAGAQLGGQACHGVFVIVPDRDRLRPMRVGAQIAATLSKLYGPQFKLEDAARLLGSKRIIA